MSLSLGIRIFLLIYRPIVCQLRPDQFHCDRSVSVLSYCTTCNNFASPYIERPPGLHVAFHEMLCVMYITFLTVTQYLLMKWADIFAKKPAMLCDLLRGCCNNTLYGDCVPVVCCVRLLHSERSVRTVKHGIKSRVIKRSGRTQ